MILWVGMMVASLGASLAGNDNAALQADLGTCLATLKSQGQLPSRWQLGPGTLPTTFSEFSQDEGNTILFHTPTASYKIHLMGRGAETYSPQSGQNYYAMLESLIEKSEDLDGLLPSCGKVEQFKPLFSRLTAKSKVKAKASGN